LCAEAIRKSFDFKNLFEVLVLAYEYDSEHLKETIRSFLLDNREQGCFTSLTMTTKWINFVGKNQQLANEILAGVYGTMGNKLCLAIDLA
jgi:hypothetical protein